MAYEEILLRHVPTGEILDHLVSKLYSLPRAENMGGTPSVHLLEQFLTKDVDSACNAVAMIQDPEILQRIFQKDKRVNVRVELGRNKHLPFACAQDLYRSYKGSRGEDQRLGLLQQRSAPEILTLLQGTTHRPRLERAAVWLNDLATPEGTQAILDLKLEDLNLLVGTHWMNTLDGNVRPLVVALFQNSKGNINDPRIKTLLSKHPFTLEEVLSFPWSGNGLWGLERSIGHKDTQGVLRSLRLCAGTTDMNTAIYTLHRGGWVLGPEEAAFLVTQATEFLNRNYYAFNLTPESAAVLVAHASWNVQQKYLTEVTDMDLLYTVLSDNLGELRHTRLPFAQTIEMWKRGLPLDAIVRFLTYPGGEEPPEDLRTALLSAGHILPGMSLTQAEADLVLAGTKPAEQPTNGLKLITQCSMLTTTQRIQAASWLSESERRAWLTNGRANPCQYGDLARLEKAGVSLAGIVLEGLFRNVGMSGDTWLDEYLQQAVAPWRRGLGERSLRYVSTLLQENFQDNLENWDTALALMPDWMGTTQELIEAVQAL